MTVWRRWVGLSVKVTVDDRGSSPMMSLGVTDRGVKFRLSVVREDQEEMESVG